MTVKRIAWKRILFFSTLLSFFCYQNTTFAAQPSPIPASAEAGRTAQQLRLPVTLKTKQAPGVMLPETQEPKLSKQVASIRFKLNGIIIEGNTIYPQAELYWLFRDFLDNQVTLAELEHITHQITLKYRNNGYILSKAYIPPQRVTTGVVHIQVVEGFVDKVTIEGDAPHTRNLIQQYGSAIIRSGPLQIKTLERYILLANDLPGVKVRAVLKPSEVTPGAANLVLVASEKPAAAYVNYNNRGTRFLGPDQYMAGGALNNVLRAGDSTEIRYAGTYPFRELQFTAISHEEQIGANGIRLTIDGDYTHTAPGGTLAPLKIDGKNLDVGATLAFPMLRTRDQNLYIDSGLKFTKSTTDIIGDTRLFNDKIYALTLGGSYDITDGLQGINSVRAHLIQGLPVFNATKNSDQLASRPDARGDFTKFDIDISREQLITERISILLAASGQYAANPLFSVEQFGIGGSPYGGAYDPSEIVGDHGLAGKAELRYQLPAVSSRIPVLFPDTQLYTYYDGGEVWNIKHLNQQAHQSITSFGLGARFKFVKYVDGYIEWAKPLTKNVAAEQTVGKGKIGRLFVGISAKL